MIEDELVTRAAELLAVDTALITLQLDALSIERKIIRENADGKIWSIQKELIMPRQKQQDFLTRA